MHIENPEYEVTLFYAGADGSEYAQDKAAGQLDRKKLSAVCKPKSRGHETNLGSFMGHVVLKPLPINPNMTISEARRFAEELMTTIDSATALDDFITARFGPAVWPDDD